jgi:hypothetical protein
MNNLLIVERKDLVSDKVLIVNVELVKPREGGVPNQPMFYATNIWKK